MSYTDNSRTNDGLDVSRTTDAYSDNNNRGSNTTGYRSNDGLDPSSTTDAYNTSADNSSGSYRSNDGLDASNTSDAYTSTTNQGSGPTRTTDGLDPTGTTDAQSGYGSRDYDNQTRNDRPGGTSGGLGYDDTIGTAPRTGGGNRGGTQETSQHTSGGLGENDTYGDEADTGGNDTGYDHNYGMGTGRTISQEEGGPLPTEPGRQDVYTQDGDFDERPGEYMTKPGYEEDTSRMRSGDNDNGGYNNSSSKNKDSTTGKLMEKAGGLLKNQNLAAKGAEKRREAGGYE